MRVMSRSLSAIVCDDEVFAGESDVMSRSLPSRVYDFKVIAGTCVNIT